MLSTVILVLTCLSVIYTNDTGHISICGDVPVPFGADSTELLAALRNSPHAFAGTIVDSTAEVVTYEYVDGYNLRHYRTYMGKFFNRDIVYYPTDGMDRYHFVRRTEKAFRKQALDSIRRSNSMSYIISCDDGQQIDASISSAGPGIRLSITSNTVYEMLYGGE
jgi:hypothetical protein